MIVRPPSHSELRDILRRQEQLHKHQPTCPSCATNQVQLVGREPPARWRCRRCKHWFTSEPTALTSQHETGGGK